MKTKKGDAWLGGHRDRCVSSLAGQGVNPGLRVSKSSCSGAASGTVSHVEPGAFITVRVLALAGNMQVVDQAGLVVAQ